MSVEVLDIILEYLYTREPIEVIPSLAIELYAAAKRLDLKEIKAQVEAFCLSNPQVILTTDVLWHTPKIPSDIEVFISFLEEVSFAAGDRTALMECFHQWSTSDTGIAEVFKKFHEKLLSQWPTSTLTVRRMSTPQQLTVAVLGDMHCHRHSLVYTLVFLSTANDKHNSSSRQLLAADGAASGGDQVNSGHEHYKYTTMDIRLKHLGGFHNGHLIHGNFLYGATWAKLSIYALNSDKLLQTIPNYSVNSDSIGICAFKNEVFFYTHERVYLCHPHGLKRTLVFRRDPNSSWCTLTVLEFTWRRAVFAVQDRRCSDMVKVYISDPTTLQLQIPSRVINIPPNLQLVGSHAGLLYFWTEC